VVCTTVARGLESEPIDAHCTPLAPGGHAHRTMRLSMFQMPKISNGHSRTLEQRVRQSQLHCLSYIADDHWLKKKKYSHQNIPIPLNKSHCQRPRCRTFSSKSCSGCSNLGPVSIIESRSELSGLTSNVAAQRLNL
jgi:hypothetical protein